MNNLTKMKPHRFFPKLFAAVASMSVMLSSCSSMGGGVSAGATIDPRFIGTWVGQAEYRGKERDVVLVLSPTGKGDIHARGNGAFDRTPIKWSTRSNILELRENVGLFNVAFNFSYGNVPYGGYGSYRRYGQQNYQSYQPPPSPIGGVRRYNVISLEAKAFTARDIGNPRKIDRFTKYSARPTSDPFPAFSWMDNGSQNPYQISSQY